MYSLPYLLYTSNGSRHIATSIIFFGDVYNVRTIMIQCKETKLYVWTKITNSRQGAGKNTLEKEMKEADLHINQMEYGQF